MGTVDLNQLPVPDVVEVLDYETLLAERKATLISLYPEDQQEAIKRVIEQQAWIISRVVHNLNGRGYTTGLELEVKVSDVEYESEELNQ